LLLLLLPSLLGDVGAAAVHGCGFGVGFYVLQARRLQSASIVVEDSLIEESPDDGWVSALAKGTDDMTDDDDDHHDETDDDDHHDDDHHDETDDVIAIDDDDDVRMGSETPVAGEGMGSADVWTDHAGDGGGVSGLKTTKHLFGLPWRT
jgi:hypothetical protein